MLMMLRCLPGLPWRPALHADVGMQRPFLSRMYPLEQKHPGTHWAVHASGAF